MKILFGLSKFRLCVAITCALAISNVFKPRRIQVRGNRSLLHNDGTETARWHSKGLYNNVLPSEWEKARSRFRNHLKAAMRSRPKKYFRDFECISNLELGEGNVVCAPDNMAYQIAAHDGQDGNGCLVYMIGKYDKIFIEDTQDLIDESCEFHIFSSEKFGEKNNLENVHLHKYDIASSLSLNSLEHLSFQDAVRDLGHQDHTIDILKIDCEGCDSNIFLDVFDAKVTVMQILVKSDTKTDLGINNIITLKDKGYVSFYSSVTNDVYRLSLMKLAKDFFLSPSEVPHTLIFTFKKNILNTEQPELFYENVQNTVESYRNAWDDPDARVLFMNDSDCINLIFKTYPLLQPYFRNEKRGAIKGDICRIVALYVFGGYYFDVDLEVIEPYIPASDISFATVQGPIPSIFFQAFVASIPKHPIIAKNLQVILDMYDNSPGRPQGLVGCWSMKKAYESLLSEKRGKTHILEELKLGPEEKYMDLPEREGYGCCCNNVVIDTNDKKAYFYSRIRGYTNRCSLLPLEGEDARWN